MDLKWIEKILPKNLLGEFYETILPGLTFWFWLQFKQGILIQNVNFEDVMKASFISMLFGNVTFPLCDRIYHWISGYFSELLYKDKPKITPLQEMRIHEFYIDSNSIVKTNYSRNRSKIIGALQLILYLSVGAMYMSIFIEFTVYQIIEFVAVIFISVFGVILPTRTWIENVETYIANKTYFDEGNKKLQKAHISQ